MDESYPTLKDFQEYINKVGRAQANKVIEILGEQNQFYEAFNTPIGRELLKDAVNRVDELNRKIWKEEENDMERAEFRVLKQLISRWSKKIDAYVKNLEVIKGNGKL
jgi:DNA-binding PadR family transcriptional regulator